LQEDASNAAAYGVNKKPEVKAKKQDGGGRHVGFTKIAKHTFQGTTCCCQKQTGSAN
jgi:hypothetical protein